MNKKLIVVLGLVGLILATLVIAKIGKPTVVINTGLFFPSDIVGYYEVSRKGIPILSYSFKAKISNLYGFSVEAYKKENPDDLISGRGKNAKLLTNDAANLILNIKAMGYRWVRIELRGLKGELVGVHEENYLGFL